MHSAIDENPALRAAIQRLQGRRLIFTNGSRKHAEGVALKLGLAGLFEDICDITACGYVPKPDRRAFEGMVSRHGFAGHEAAMFEDMPQNLEVPHALGMATVLVRSAYMDHPIQEKMKKWTSLPTHIHHDTSDLTAFLDAIEFSAS